MADKRSTIDIIFGGVDNTGSAIRSVGAGLSSLESSVGSVTAPLADITDSILQLDAVLATAAAGLTAYAIKVSNDFGTSFAEIATLIDAPAENLGSFKDSIQNYAESSTKSFEDITAATYSAISAGVDYKDSLEILAAAETLSIAGRADLGSTTNALVSVMNAFGAEMSEAGSYTDIFFTTVKKGQTTIPELASSISAVAPLAAAAGVSFEELSAAIATITAETGTGTAETMTALKAAISNIIKPSSQAAETASALGIQFDAAALKSKGFAGILDDVARATGGDTEVMAKLFGSVEALNAVLPLTGKAAGAFALNLEAINASSGSAAKAAAILRDDLSLLTKTLENAVTSAFISFGDNLTDETIGIVKSVTSIFNSIGDEISLSDGTFAPVIAQLEDVFKDIQVKFEKIAENFPAALKNLKFDELISAFDDLGGSLSGIFTALFGDIDITTVEGLSSALQTMVDAFTSLVSVTSGIFDGLKPLFELIGGGVEKFQNLTEEQKKSIGEMLGLAKAIDTVLSAVGALGTGLESVGNGLIALAGAKGIPAIIGQLGSLSSIAASAGRYGVVGAAVFGAAGAGAAFGEGINQLYEALAGNSIGSSIYNLVHGDEFVEQQTKITKATRETSEYIAEAREIQEGFNRVIAQGSEARKLDIVLLNAHAAELVKNQDETKKALGIQNESNAALEYNAGTLASLNDAIANGSGAVAKTAKFTKELAENNQSLTVSYDASGQKINSWSGTVIKSAKALTDQKKATEDATKTSEAYQLKLLEIASDERIANIEAKISLDIAQLEAQTEIAKGIIESISTTIESTGSLIGSLFGDYSAATGLKKHDIASQIERENRAREEAFELQKSLTNAQIEQINERTRAIKKGTSAMKIELDRSIGPALEMVMREILNKTKIWASESGDNFLLGI